MNKIFLKISSILSISGIAIIPITILVYPNLSLYLFMVVLNTFILILGIILFLVSLLYPDEVKAQDSHTLTGRECLHCGAATVTRKGFCTSCRRFKGNFELSFANYMKLLAKVVDHFEVEYLQENIEEFPTIILKSDQFIKKTPNMLFAPRVVMQFNVYITKVDHVTMEKLETFSKACFQYGKDNLKELFLKKKDSYGCIAIQATRSFDNNAREYVLTKGDAKWGGSIIRGILDLNDMRFYYLNKSPYVGKFLFNILREFTMKYLSLEI